MSSTKISWATHTHNWMTWCEKMGPECLNCYAIKMSFRLGNMGQAPYQGTAKVIGPVKKRKFAWVPGKGITINWEAMRTGIPSGKPKIIFVNSMSDTFHPGGSMVAISEYLELVAENPQHRFMFLTKRADVMVRWAKYFDLERKQDKYGHVMWGITAGVQESLDLRLPLLLQMPGRKWVSAEPLLGDIVLPPSASAIDYLVVGGESGAGARPMHPDDLNRLVNRCRDLGIPVHFKQWGAWMPMDFNGIRVMNDEQVQMAGHKGIKRIKLNQHWMYRLGSPKKTNDGTGKPVFPSIATESRYLNEEPRPWQAK